ncbi:hypothetical protein Leryth_021608 [Lithospermum erythrorhizon]|nr:hypothetical protein Leryth_021608 [Lithospermum erythrorhizon]
MALPIRNVYFAALIFVMLPFASQENWWDNNLPPSQLENNAENICNEKNCGTGKCEAAPGEAFNFKCRCEAHSFRR